MKKVLAITGYGVKIASSGNRFVIKSKDNKNEIVADDISEIILYGRSLDITTNAIMLAIKNSIPIFFSTKFGKPYSMIMPIFTSGTVLSRREQYLAINDGRGLELAKAFVYGKIKNQERLLRIRANDLLKSDREKSMKVRVYADEIRELAKKVDNIGNKTELLELEAMVAKNYYWQGFATLIPEGLEFRSREHKGSKDPINSLLNYGYGFLLTRVINAIILAGLDPYAGFLHSDRPGRPSLALDLIEEFRQPIVDHTILKILRLKAIRFDNIIDNDRLSRDSISILLKYLKERIEEKKGLHALESHILEQARNISRFLRGEIHSYKPFML
ncbi:MAG: CRISPR-associated endonuclease Cas1 [Candidatus Nitrosocaldaceae archaeon]|nr:MAG: CRISPR-associated endonuclease Cas1 [Candidatus Nitrosocaldaceae archaeon]